MEVNANKFLYTKTIELKMIIFLKTAIVLSLTKNVDQNGKILISIYSIQTKCR